VFELQHVPVRVGTLSEFNARTAELAKAAVVPVACEAAGGKSLFSGDGVAGAPAFFATAPALHHPFSMCCTEIVGAPKPDARGSVRFGHPRHSVSVSNLLPHFYHASRCCSQEWLGTEDEGVRHHLDCSHRRDVLKQKRAAQERQHRKQLRDNAAELCTMDEGAAAPQAVDGVCDCPSPALVTLQEKRAPRGFVAFQATFLGMPSL